MDQPQKTSSRKKFLLWSATILSSLTVLNFVSGNKPPKKETVKMLTKDGILVEVEIDKLSSGRRNKIDDEQLKNWVSKK